MKFHHRIFILILIIFFVALIFYSIQSKGGRFFEGMDGDSGDSSSLSVNLVPPSKEAVPTEENKKTSGGDEPDLKKIADLINKIQTTMKPSDINNFVESMKKTEQFTSKDKQEENEEKEEKKEKEGFVGAELSNAYKPIDIFSTLKGGCNENPPSSLSNSQGYLCLSPQAIDLLKSRGNNQPISSSQIGSP